MTYMLTQDQRDWLQDAINLMQPGPHKTQAQNWLNNNTTVTDQQLAALLAMFTDESGLYPQVDAFVSWVKGSGVRPPHPH